ncbi:MAG: hypothetical protein U1C72_00800, partial [Candidatus Pacearchaeota archaeon]|nr:hypothetical protein [Candidatus Pacearchaeota archaeon]
TGLRAVPTENGSVAIPTTLEWNDMPGAASYSYDVMQGANSIIRGVTSGGDSRVEIGKELRQNTQYAWRVRTCADAKEEICSAWSQSSFRTAFLVAPQIIPDQTLTTPSDNLSWKTVFGASFYRYELTYAALGTEEVSSSCRNSLGKVTSRGTATGDSALLSLLCTGTYQVRIQGCTDEECKDAGPWSSQQNFSVKEPDTSGVFGLVPCGVGVNNPNTPWDERQPCGFEHMLLLVRNLIDFALWKLSLIIVVLFAIATGAMFYLSFGGSDLLAQIKSIWKAVGAGVLVLLLSWLLLNLLLGLLGFDVNIFGRWYEIPLQ